MSTPETEVKIAYQATETLARFHVDPSFMRIVRGPAGSGKSVGCLMEAIRLCSLQPKQRDGIRRTRTLVIRNTYLELLNTTLKTFKTWLPPQVFTSRVSPTITGTLKMADMEIEFDFLSGDDDKRIRQLKSYECSNVYGNEVVELPKSLWDACSRAVGRYPRVQDGGVARPCVYGDTNSCDMDHWLYHMAEIEKPRDFAVFVQPGAFLAIAKGKDGRMLYAPNPKAENIANLEGGYDYYRRMMVGKKDSWIAVFVLNKYGDVLQGRPCYPEFSERNVRPTIPVLRGLGLRLGWDYGRTPACVVYQKTPEGQTRVLRSIRVDPRGDGMALRTFVRTYVRPTLEAEFPGLAIIQSTGDPAGASGGQAEEATCEDVLAEEGFPTQSAPTNDIEARLGAVSQLLLGSTRTGEPMLIVSQEGCPTFISGLRGKYQMERQRVQGAEGLYKDTPLKNGYSHEQDAFQYGALGSRAETVALTSRTTQALPVAAPRRYGT